MRSTLPLLLSAALWLNVKAEWALNVLEKASPGNFETIVLYDSYSGCVKFNKPVTGWFKEPFDNTAWAGVVEFFADTGCEGALKDARQWSSVGFKDFQGFASGTAASVYITSETSSKRSVDVVKGRGSVTLNEFREIIPTETLEARNRFAGSKLEARFESPDAMDSIEEFDRLLEFIQGGVLAVWEFANIRTGVDAGRPILPMNSVIDWATSIADGWDVGVLTGELDSFVGSWLATLHGTHTHADISNGIMRNAMFRAIQDGAIYGKTWIQFDIADWTGNSIATFIIWMEG